MWILNQEKNELAQIEEIKLKQATEWNNPTLSLIIGISKTGFTYELGYYETPERTKKVFAMLIDAITSNETFFEMPALNSIRDAN